MNLKSYVIPRCFCRESSGCAVDSVTGLTITGFAIKGFTIKAWEESEKVNPVVLNTKIKVIDKLKVSLFLFALMLFQNVWASIDELQVQVDKDVKAELRWDNLQGDKDWLSGPRPEKGQGQYWVKLSEGESVVIVQPAYSWLRVISNEEKLLLNSALQVERSTDGKLFIAQNFIKAQSTTEKLYNALLKASQKTTLIRLQNSSNKTLKIALYRSRLFNNSPQLIYTKLMPMPLENVNLQISSGVDISKFWILPKLMKGEMKSEWLIKGPQRLQINLRKSLEQQTSPASEVHLSLMMDGKQLLTYELFFKEDYLNVYRVKGRRVVMSNEESIYIDIPEGEHKLRLKSSDELYVQTYSLDKQYWTKTNLPKTVRWLNSANKIKHQQVKENNSLQAFASLSQFENTLLSLARNNQQSESALGALAKIDVVLQRLINKNRWVSDWSVTERLLKLKDKIKQEYTRLYPLYPFLDVNIDTGSPSVIKQRWFRYLKTRLQFKQHNKPFNLNESFYRVRLKQIGGKAFHQLENSLLNYALDKLDYPSELQISIYNSKDEIKVVSPSESIWLQIDNQPPQLLKLRDADIAKAFVAPSVSKAVLKSQGCCQSQFGLASVNKNSTQLVSVNSLKLPLGAKRSRIKIWKDGGEPLWVALQQRRSVNYQLSESQYLYQIEQNHGFYLFVHLLEGYKAGKSQKNNKIVADLDNHWHSYIQYLYMSYQQRIDDTKLLELEASPTISAELAQATLIKAQQAEQVEQWTLALEYWSQLLRSGYAEQQRVALKQIAINLKRTGQYSLAKKLQQTIIFSAPSDVIPVSFSEYQLKLLLSEYQQQNNADARLSLLSAYFVHKPSQKNLQRLAKALIEEGRALKGLQLFLLLPESYQLNNEILMGALQNGWISVFDKQLEKANFSERENIKWLGLRALYRGEFLAAKEKFNKANIKTDSQLKVWLSILNESLELQDELIKYETLNKDDGEYLYILKQWQVIQKKSNQLSYTKWQQASPVIQSHAGQETLKNRLSKQSLVHYLSRPQQPIKMRVAGPIQLRLQLRPVHKLTNMKIHSLDSYCFIESDNKRIDVLINHNLPEKNWSFSSVRDGASEQWVPGQRKVKNLKLGPGLHHLKIVCEDDFLVRVQRQVSTVPVNVLPDLNAENMQALLSSVQMNNQQENLKVNIFTGFREINDSVDKSMFSLEKLNTIALQLESPKSTKTALQIASAEKIFSNLQAGLADKASSTMSRIREKSKWQLLNSFEQSDGFWVRRYQGFQAESPQSRLFQALISERGRADELLRNGGSQIVSIFNPKKSILVLHLKSVAPFFISSQPLKVSYQIDNDKAVYITLDENLQKINLALSTGKHSIKITVLEAAVHHRMWLSIQTENGQSLAATKSRRYQLASEEQALVYRLQGPAWLRIDKFVNNKTEITYQYISPGVQRLKLGVDEREKTAYYRVFKRVENKTIKPTKYFSWNLSTTQSKAVEENPQSLELFDLNSNEGTHIKLYDAWRLGKQQKGTTSLAITQVDQNLIIDELAVTTDQYLESELAYREYLNMSKRWFYVAGVARLRNEGNPTLGVKSRLRGQFDWNAVDWTVDGRAYAQELISGTESSTQILMRLSQTRWLGRQFYHLPKVAVFFRWLSASRNTDTDNQIVDRDVYSDYKKDHPSGVRVSETLIYRLYQDAEFYVNGALLTNANWIELDQYSARLGARMQWGGARWDINMRRLEFTADDDRLQARSRSVIQAKFLIEKWIYPRYRAELATAIDHDVVSGDDTLRLQFSVHQSEGRGYRDYSPAETLFRNVRQSNLNLELNNGVN